MVIGLQELLDRALETLPQFAMPQAPAPPVLQMRSVRMIFEVAAARFSFDPPLEVRQIPQLAKGVATSTLMSSDPAPRGAEDSSLTRMACLYMKLRHPKQPHSPT